VDSIAAVELSTPSLKLRYAGEADAPALFELGSDPEVTRFFSWGPYRSVGEPLAYVERLAGERDRGERLEFLMIGASGPLGVTGLSEFSRRDRRAVVGTWLGRAYWGSGANAASKALIAWLAFERLGLERLGAYADVENPRSQAALLKLGFEREGTLRRWHRHGDRVHDVVLYSWLKEEWERSPLSREPVAMVGVAPEAFRVG
jgi:[ribosomal protein S5]-alanine N-acetyltransferase